MVNRNNYFQRGESGLEFLLGAGFVVVCLVAFLGGVFKVVFGGEDDGVAKYDDCRQIITIQDGNLYTYFHKFTCQVSKTNSGKIIGGTCVSLEIQNGICTKAMIYEKK